MQKCSELDVTRNQRTFNERGVFRGTKRFLTLIVKTICQKKQKTIKGGYIPGCCQTVRVRSPGGGWARRSCFLASFRSLLTLRTCPYSNDLSIKMLWHGMITSSGCTNSVTSMSTTVIQCLSLDLTGI